MKQLILLLIFIPSLLFSQGKLDNEKKSLSKNNSSQTKSTSTSKVSRSKDRTDNKTDVFEDVKESFAALFFEMVYLATYGVVIGKTDFKTFNPYPYYDLKNGEYDGDRGNKYQLLKFGANHFMAKEIKGYEINLNYRFVYFLGIEGNFQHFTEKTEQRTFDFLDISSLTLNYY